MALTKITKSGIGNDAIDSSDKIADDVISEEHLDKTAVTGHTELAAEADVDDILLVYDASADAVRIILTSSCQAVWVAFTYAFCEDALA